MTELNGMNLEVGCKITSFDKTEDKLAINTKSSLAEPQYIEPDSEEEEELSDNMLKIAVKLLTDTAIIPKQGSKGAAGSDLYADILEDVIILPGKTTIIKTGIAMQIPEDYVGLIYARSGKSIKEDLAPANKVGVIDSDYRGEIMVALHNHGLEMRVIHPNERIAQIVFQKCYSPRFYVVSELDETERGEGRLGSTGKE